VRLALLPDGRSPGDCYPLAPCRLASVLALSDAPRPAADSLRASPFDSAHGQGKLFVGPGTHRQRTPAQARAASFASYRSQVHAQAGAWPPARRSTLATFLRNHAQAIIACDFFVAVTATFRMVYVFVVIHHGSRRLLHQNVTSNPTAAWTLQQIRETIGFHAGYGYLLHDRDSIFSQCFDRSVEALALRVLRSPPRSPKANAICERLIGTIRRDCLNWLDPIVRTSFARDSEIVGGPLQPWAPAHVIGSWSAGSTSRPETCANLARSAVSGLAGPRRWERLPRAGCR
jgi:hypothetical protein